MFLHMNEGINKFSLNRRRMSNIKLMLPQYSTKLPPHQTINLTDCSTYFVYLN